MIATYKLVDASNAPVTGATPVVTVDGAAAAGTNEEVGSGWYRYTLATAEEAASVVVVATAPLAIAVEIVVDQSFDPASDDVTVGGFAAGVASALAALIEAALVNETDATAMMQAIVDKFAAAYPDLDDVTLAALAAALRADIERAGGLLDLTKTSADTANRTAPDNASAQAAAASAASADGKLSAERLAAIDGALQDEDYVAPPSALDIDAQLSGTHGPGAWTTTLGTGAIAWPYDVLLDSNGDGIADDPPVGIEGVFVIVTTDAAGTVRVDEGYTNSAGRVVFHLDNLGLDGEGEPLPHYFWRRHSLFRFPDDPDTEVVS